MSQPPNTTSSSAGQRDDVADFRRTALGPLAEADRAHLRERADWLREAFANGEDAGDGGGADRAESDEQNAEFPCRFCDFWRIFHDLELYHQVLEVGRSRLRSRRSVRTLMFKWFRPAALDPLSVSMAGAKLGDRVLVVGCSDPRLVAALAAKAGLSGRACAVDESADLATRSGTCRAQRRRAHRNIVRPVARARVRDASRSISSSPECRHGDRQVAGTGRPRSVAGAATGRAVHGHRHLPAAAWRQSLAARRRPASVGATESVEVLKGQGFVAVRTLAERDGLRFVEAIKKNS